MKIKFKDLGLKKLKIEKLSEYFGINNVFEICNYYNIMPNMCSANSWTIANKCIINNIRFEYVECFIKFNRDNMTYYKPHALNYWNGHYFDLTLEYPIILNKIQNEYYFVMPEYDVIMFRRFNRDELLKAIHYTKENLNGNIVWTYIGDKTCYIDNKGNIRYPNEQFSLYWKDDIIEDIHTKTILECDFKKFNNEILNK